MKNLSKKLILTCVLIACFSGLLYAGNWANKLPIGSIVCEKKDHLNQIMDALVDKDNRAYNYLFTSSKCVKTKLPFEITVIDAGLWSNRANIRIYLGKRAFEMWTFTKNVRIK